MSLQSQPILPPHSLDAERSLLGGLMLNNRRFDDIATLLRAEDFYQADHATIFAAIAEMLGANRPCDFITLSEHLKARGTLDEVGGIAYLGELANDALSGANVAAYAAIIRDASALRALISAGGDLAELGYRTEGRAAAELLDLAEQKVFALRREAASRVAGGPQAYSEVMPRVMDGIERNMKSGTSTTGLRTGLADLDAKTSGLQPTDLIVVAARPSMGKSALVGSIGDFVAQSRGKTTLVFSMEMSAEQWAIRSLANRSSVPLDRLLNGQLDDVQMDRVVSADAALREAAIEVDDSASLSPLELRARARRVASRGNLGLIVVDYIQLMRVPGTKENRTNEVAEISRSLKALAKELGVPVVALSQLNRSLEQRDNKRPRMSDLRESGSIEQDADLIVFIYRDDVYNSESAHPGTAELIIGKHRQGALGTVRVAFQGQYARFVNLAEDWRADAAADNHPAAYPPRPPRRGHAGRVVGMKGLLDDN